ncbi:MAG: hypothetical protein ABL907_19525 [Hyphomicrobium sp.]
MKTRTSVVTALLLAAGAALGLSATAASALTAAECSAKYKAAKAADALGGKTWNDFRKAECGEAAAPAAEVKKAVTAETAKPAVATGTAVFPKALSSKYASEKPSKARMHTCLDQYKANKVSNGNGGLKWIMKGGGYYSECNKKLKS